MSHAPRRRGVRSSSSAHAAAAQEEAASTVLGDSRPHQNEQIVQLVDWVQGRPQRALELHQNGRVIVPTGKDQQSGGGRAPGRAQWALQQCLMSTFQAVFLPDGFPASVAPEYVAFQAWDTAQALCSYVRGLLTAQAIFKGVGVGQEAATPLAVTLNFFVRDLAGMLGGILFAFAQGSSFDTCAKQWRLFADVTNDIGMAVELASPLAPRGLFLPLACVGSVARAVTGVAGGATRVALTQHFALRGNAADVSAKEQSQETATTLVGMLLGMAFTKVTAEHVLSAWALFWALTLLHVWANVRALRCLVIATVNAPRLELLLKHFQHHATVPTPRQVAASETLVAPPLRPLVRWLAGRPPQQPVRLGCGLADLACALQPPRGGRATSRGASSVTATAEEARQRRYSGRSSSSGAGAGAGWGSENERSLAEAGFGLGLGLGWRAACQAACEAGSRGQPYVVVLVPGGGLGSSGGTVLVAVHRDHTAPTDLFRVHTHAALLAAGVSSPPPQLERAAPSQGGVRPGPLQKSRSSSPAAGLRSSSGRGRSSGGATGVGKADGARRGRQETGPTAGERAGGRISTAEEEQIQWSDAWMRAHFESFRQACVSSGWDLRSFGKVPDRLVTYPLSAAASDQG